MSNLSTLTFASRSHPLLTGADLLEVLAGLAAGSHAFNRAAGITSAVTWYRGSFVQVMEGPGDALEALVSRIGKDARHHDLRVIHAGPATQRLFPERPMAVLDPALVSDDMQDMLQDGAPEDAPVLAQRIAELLRAGVAGDAPALPARPGPRYRPDLNPELAALNEHVATALLSPSGHIMRANRAYAALFGLTPESVQGHRRRDLAIEDEGTVQAQQRLWRHLRLGETQLFDYSALRPDGAEVRVHGRFVPRLSAEGQLAEIVEIATDITAEYRRTTDERGRILAIDGSQAVIHFSPKGEILHANPCFLDDFGYAPEELAGRHHQVLMPSGEACAGDARLWTELEAGIPRSGEFRRIGKDGREISLRGSYDPVFDARGGLLKVVLHAINVTEDRRRRDDCESQVAALGRSQAVITFSTDGLILDANENFLVAMGYALHEVVGRHHRIFVEPAYAHGSEYARFWRMLAEGQYQAGEYRRIGRDGSDVWLQAVYSPVLDTAGRPTKIIKYATVVTEERLRQAEHQGQIAAIHKAQCVISFDLGGRIVDANENFLDRMGYRLSEVRGCHHSLFMQPGEAQGPAYQTFWSALALGQHQSGEFRRRTKDGRDIWLRATYNPILDLSGRPFRVIKYATDVTAEKLRQADFQGQIEAIQKSTGVVAFSMAGEVLEANQSFLDMVGYTMDELRGLHHRVLAEPADAASAEYQAFWDTLQAGKFTSGLYRRVGRRGQAIWIQASYNPILDLDGRPIKIMKFATDVTSNVALAEAYEDAKRQAQHDPATSLPNRVRLNAFMTQALSRPESRLAVFYLDLDRFKPINDTHGHEVGDRVLGEVADRLRRVLSNEQLAARVGGDEFVVVAPDMAEEDIDSFATALTQAITAPIQVNSLELSVGVSIGVSVGPADGTAPDELLRGADAALYRSKQRGGGLFSYYANDMNERLLSYRNTVDDLRQAIEAGQLFLEYQPRFETTSRRVRSVEALIRWRHPERGRVSPGEFIPVAERSGLITRIGAWVLETACRDAMQWPSIGVSVNVSPIQFREPDFVDMVKGILRATDLPPQRLELEITEGVIVQDAVRAERCLLELSGLGVKLAMDDFGTGYSSLSSLRSFPFDVIKIDRQFIADMQTRVGGRDVVQAILSMGKGLGMSVTAEGVETDVQLEMLRNDDCAEVQGFYLARPMHADGVTELLAAEDQPSFAGT